MKEKLKAVMTEMFVTAFYFYGKNYDVNNYFVMARLSGWKRYVGIYTKLTKEQGINNG